VISHRNSACHWQLFLLGVCVPGFSLQNGVRHSTSAYKKQEKDFHATFVNKLLTNEAKGKLSCKNNTCQDKMILSTRKII
jgi:hypothetical protein